MDGLSLYAVSVELQALIGGKIDKVQQPERDTILLTARAGGSNHKLLLCAHPQNGRVQLTEAGFKNPSEAPAFCMLLRKRIGGGCITSITQPQLDRVLHIDIEARDELGDKVRLSLIVELMGKYSNIIFINEEGTILDCARRVHAAMSSVRMLLPGLSYELPPQQEKRNPLLTDETGFQNVLEGRESVSKLLCAAFFGLSPDCARQMVCRWSGESELLAEKLTGQERAALARYLTRMYQSFASGAFTPTLVYNAAREPVAVYAFEPGLPKDTTKGYRTMSEALDAYYTEKDLAERLRGRSASLNRILQNNLERCYKKLALFEASLNIGDDLEQYRLFGELLTTHAHELKRGMRHAKLENYYLNPPTLCVVPLDERLSPQENAQTYFKRYQKGKAAMALAVEQRRQTKAEIVYLEGQIDNLTKCTTDVELMEIREELVQEGYAKPEEKAGKNKPKKKQATQASQPLHLRSSDGLDIYIGKNNQQNDALTLCFARSEDWWMHTKEMPGSHVLVRCEGELPETTLREAAMLAAYYSKARASASVPVDYALKKYVKKPNGAKPGMVIYTHQKTVYVTPDEAAVKRMQAAIEE